MSGPLAGIKVVEFVGLGPAPFAAMMLADMGADVIRIDRPPVAEASTPYPILGTRHDLMARGRRSLALDLKRPQARELALELVERADGLLEGFRPGVMERLGLGPQECLSRNPRLVYTRVTGWGQEGPLAQAAGHDLNYLALTGLLPSMGRPGSPPPPPLNLVGDFGGGGMLAAFGLACGVIHARATGQGQVVDAAMLDGSSLLGTMIHGFHAMGGWSATRGRNWIDGGAPYYDSYECADGRYVAIGPIEPAFWRELLQRAGADDPDLAEVGDMDRWPQQKDKMAALFRTRTRDQWCALLEGGDACFSPVLGLEEAPTHPHHRARQGFIEVGGVRQPAPAPRFSRTPGAVTRPPSRPGADGLEIVRDWGLSPAHIAELQSDGVIVARTAPQPLA